MASLLLPVLALLVLAAACGGRARQDGAILFITPATTTPSPTLAPSPEPAPTPTPEPVLPQLSLEAIFGGPPTLPEGLDPKRLRTLIATGDVVPVRYSDYVVRLRGNDFLYPFAATAEVVRAADITLINLEAALIDQCPLHRDGFVFCGQPGYVEGLLHAGVDVASLESNHIGDYGEEGIAATKALLRQHGIDYADRATLAVRDVRGLRFGFLAFNGVTGTYIDREATAAAIRQADPQVDVLVVAMHWGQEYVAVPELSPGIAPDDPVEIAHLAVEAGADLIIGNGPHWVQAVELYKGKLIAYAHGNFVFDQMWSLETRQSVVGRYTFYDGRLIQVEYWPTLIENYAQPRFLAGEEAQAVLERMHEASQALASELMAGGQATPR